MALLVDKHRPRSLEALSYHHDLSARLKALVNSLYFTPEVYERHLTTNSSRHKAVISLTSLSMALLVQARRPALSPR